MRTTALTNTLFDDLMRDLNRVAIGFEPTIRRLHDVQNSFTTSSNGYPPYDLEAVSENHYRITLAVAGFTEQDIDIEVKDDQLSISGEIKDKPDVQYVFKGIANRAFTRIFHLADHVRISDATLANGLLTIDLIREIPEALKPRKIEINGPKVIDAKVG